VNRILGIWRTLGPGILLAATSVGASHLVLAPRAGMLHGAALLWLVLVSHVIKYPAFELGPRYAMATGESLLSGYSRVRLRWPLYLFALFTVAQGVGVAVAVVSIAASVLAVSFGQWPAFWIALGFQPVSFWGILVATACVALIVVGRYPGMDLVNRVMMLVLVAITLVAFFVRMPEPGVWKHLVIPAVPTGSVVLVAAILGWMPTGVDVSIWHSMWALEKKGIWTGDTRDGDGSPIPGRKALLDMRVGYGISIVLGVVCYTLGMQIVADRPPDGARVAASISDAYVGALGAWSFPVFMVAAFCAMFSTAYVVMDGFPRTLSEALRLLVPSKRETQGLWKAPYYALLGIVWLAVIPVLLFVPKPVLLLKIAAVLGFLIAPLYYALNIWCAVRDIPDGPLRPGRVFIVLSVVGAALMLLASGLFIWSQFL